MLRELCVLEKFVIRGGKPLHGKVFISGAKMPLWLWSLQRFCAMSLVFLKMYLK
jgi:hypothetical protein